jgi:signal transduction histidine kinase
VGAAIIGIGSASGSLAALAGGAVSGANAPQLLVGAALGLVIGALGALGAIAVADRRAVRAFEAGVDAATLSAAASQSMEPAPRGNGATAARPPLRAGAPVPAVAASSTDSRADLRADVGAPATTPARARTAGTVRPAENLEALVTSIGHRYQSLADRQLEALTGLADDEPENGALALATRLARRMRRASKTLQVLADDPDSRETAPTATITDVIAAAIADNDEFARIDYRSLHPARVDGEIVPDLVHLLAELIDNAIGSSRTNSTSVTVLGRRSTDAYLLSVVDEGAGMPTGQRELANERVHTPPALGQQSPAAFGLPTVGRLAARHDIGVTLLEAATDGVIAKVRLPARVLGGGKDRDATPTRAKDRPAVAATGAAATAAGATPGRDDTVIDLSERGARPAPVTAAAAPGATLSNGPEGRDGNSRDGGSRDSGSDDRDGRNQRENRNRRAEPDPASRAELARQVQRNRPTPQEAPVRTSMQPASLARPTERATTPPTRPAGTGGDGERNPNRRPKDGGAGGSA